MKTGYVQDIEKLTVENSNFRHVLYTAKNLQLVVMSLNPKEDIGMEVHKADQFFRIEEGYGEVIIDDVVTEIDPGFAIIVPAGVRHNVINTGDTPLKLYTIYSPPQHKDGLVQPCRNDSNDNDKLITKTQTIYNRFVI